MKRLIIITLALFPLTLFSQTKDVSRFRLIDRDYLRNGTPTIELSYGQTNISLKNFNYYKFDDQGIIELKLGYSYKKDLKDGNSVVKYKNNYLYGSYISSKIKLNDSGYDEPTLRFGFGSSNGYGYKLGKTSTIMFYNSNAFKWTTFGGAKFITTFEYDPVRDEQLKKLRRFGTLSFGSATEGGIIIPIDGAINLQAMYDRTLIFPAHLVWKHLGSFLIEASANVLIDRFVLAIMKSSPSAVPVVNFLLKNGLSYGIYELRKSKMNWPFDSDEPLMFDSFKLGLTFNF